jgi:hypothetical protein
VPAVGIGILYIYIYTLFWYPFQNRLSPEINVTGITIVANVDIVPTAKRTHDVMIISACARSRYTCILAVLAGIAETRRLGENVF